MENFNKFVSSKLEEAQNQAIGTFPGAMRVEKNFVN